MKQKIFIILILFFITSQNVFCQKAAPDAFTASFNEIIYAFPDNFKPIKGKLDTSISNLMIWKSKVKLPDCEDGYIVFDKNNFKEEKFTEFTETIVKTFDKTKAWKRYIDYIEKIKSSYLACCFLKKEANSEEKQDSLKTEYSTYFVVESVKSDIISERFTYIKIQIQFKTSIDGEYEVKMRISDTNYY